MKTLLCTVILVFSALHLFAETPSTSDASSFDPVKGFTPAQDNLTAIFLQIAGSLECYGSPVPYLQHMKAEHLRIQAEYRKKFGKDPVDYCPSYMTDAYMEQVAKNWEKLSPKLGLAPLAKDSGHLMHDAIKGTRGTGTILVGIFDRHRANVIEELKRGKQSANFEVLRAELITQLELDKKTVNEEGYEIPRRDAISYAMILHGVIIQLFDKLDAALPPNDSDKIKGAITGIILDIGRMAESEMEVALTEQSFAGKVAFAK